MAATKLSIISVEKPWGRRNLGFGFADVPGEAPPVGEIWFDAPLGVTHELMVKYLFTSERLSIQVHPSDEQAQQRGLKSGKEEAWIILATEPGATIAMGTLVPLSGDELRRAALDGSIETLMDWKPVNAGDVYYLPAGTVHAIGAGITLIEVQQNMDVTYRLYDYGRPRELHLDVGIAVSRAEPFVADTPSVRLDEGRAILVQGRKFVIEQWTWAGTRSLKLPDGIEGWLIPVSGEADIGAHNIWAGECWSLSNQCDVKLSSGAQMLFAYAGPVPLPLFAGV